MVNICVIPAAGRGSRWAPVSGYLPKEMLPLVDKPVVEWVIEEAINSGCKKIIIIINEHKSSAKEYLIKHKNINKKVELSFIYQEKPLGITHALSLTEEYIKDQPFVLALPDLPTLSQKPVMKQMIETYLNYPEHLISFGSFSTETLNFYTECYTQKRKDNLLEIIHFCPTNTNTPHHVNSKIRMSGRYIFNPNIFEAIKKTLIKNKQKLTDVTLLQNAQLLGQKILGLIIQGHTYDTGNPLSYVRANTAFFKKKLAKIK